MYSCEKLARGRRSQLTQYEDRKFKTKISSETLPIIDQEDINRNKYQYNFADPRKYAVQIEQYEDRPRGRIYRSRKR